MFESAFRFDKIAEFLRSSALNASNKNLTSIPKEIGSLTNLFYLNLSNNSLTELPEEIGLLTHLQYLYLYGNNLTSLPKEIDQFVYLQNLKFEKFDRIQI